MITYQVVFNKLAEVNKLANAEHKKGNYDKALTLSAQADILIELLRENQQAL